LKFGLNAVYSGLSIKDSEDSLVQSVHNGPRPFKLILDTGLKRTSTGSKVFAVLKGAIDGGVKIPHNEKRFVGFDALTKKYEEDSMKNYILGSHIVDLMNDLKEEEPTRYRSQFSNYINSQIKPEELSRLYEKVHASLRENSQSGQKPLYNEAKASAKWHRKNLDTPGKLSVKAPLCVKHTYEKRKENLKKKLAAFMGL
jgi:large subunit ribosomal protein L5e